MSNPYRPDPPRNDELARLARQGQQRIAAATEGQQVHANEESNYNLRVAVGSVRGSPLRRSFLAFCVVGVLLLVTGIVAASGTILDPSMAGVLPIGFIFALGGFLTYLFVAPRASRAGMAAERAYIGSLPFVLDGYFQVLSMEPGYSCTLKIVIEWRASGTDSSTLQGLFGLIDTGARVSEGDGRTTSVVTGGISGSTGIMVNKVPVHRNHKVARYLRDLIDKVLLPLHRNVGVSRVHVSRGSW